MMKAVPPLVLSVSLALAACEPAGKPDDAPTRLRVATFNAYLNRPEAGGLIKDLGNDSDPQIAAVAEIIARERPDILLLNEFDYDPDGKALAIFHEKWLKKGFNGADGIDYPYYYSAPSNTGEPSGLDFDHDGASDGPGDAFGFGAFPGQYGMALLSRYPIDLANVRTFRAFLWKDMPGALLPDDPETPEPADYYSEEALAVFRLSSKSHWDVPVRVDGRTLHVIAAHPTPPVFDGPEDRNGRRNHDEIRFIADYIAGDPDRYIVDDAGKPGGLPHGARFVILGDMNADPHDGSVSPSPIHLLFDQPLITVTAPESAGGAEQARLQGGVNQEHRTPAATDTSDFKDSGDFASGNMRLDYVLPSAAGLKAIGAHVFWPDSNDPLFRLVGNGFPVVSSDHRMVSVDLELVGGLD